MRAVLLASVLALGVSSPAMAQAPVEPEPEPTPEGTPPAEGGPASIGDVINPQGKAGQPGGQHDGKVYDGMTLDELEPLVKGMGITHQRVAGQSAIDATSPDGLNFTLYLLDCSEGAQQRCSTLNLVSYGFLETPKVTLRGLNEWNNRAWGARGLLYKDGTSGVVANWGLDGGTTSQWVVNRIGNYFYSLKSYSDFVNGVVAAPPN